MVQELPTNELIDLVKAGASYTELLERGIALLSRCGSFWREYWKGGAITETVGGLTTYDRDAKDLVRILSDPELDERLRVRVAKEDVEYLSALLDVAEVKRKHNYRELERIVALAKNPLSAATDDLRKKGPDRALLGRRSGIKLTT